MMNAKHAKRHQLELSLETPALPTKPRRPRDRRLARAAWWFEQMHAVVDRALDWSPAPPPRPEQIRLSLANAR
jgi:hypothetical protein